MSDKTRARVEFLPAGVTAWVTPGETVLDVARAHGVAIPASCGSRGVCGTCGVRVTEGELEPPDAVETRCLGAAAAEVRLACRARIAGPVVLRPVAALSAAVTGTAASDREIVLAIDLGTTNVAGTAVELLGGREVGTATAPNRQQSWGADVLSRVAAAVAGDADALRAAAEDSVLEVAAALCGEGAKIVRVVVAANTAMAALLSGTDVSSLAGHPFALPDIPWSLGTDSRISVQLGGAEVILVPALAGFVGGDVLAGLIHTGMLYAGKPALLVDFGTNAEVALMASGVLRVASAAAGPAFEGMGIDCGGPAAPGAVSRVELAEDGGGLVLHAIGDVQPMWLSGSGLISVVATLRRLGHLSADGLFAVEGPLSQRFFTRSDGVVCLSLDDSGIIVLSQKDVRSIQLAKAAVRVGIEQVLAEAGVPASELHHLYVAGAFGAALFPGDLELLGVVPEASVAAMQWVGNASLAGSVACALDPVVLETAIERSRGVRHVDLAARRGFTDDLMRAVSLAPFDA